MIKIATFEDSFYDSYHHDNRITVAYGAGYEFKKNFDKLPKIDFICDRNAESITEYKGIKAIKPEQLQDFSEALYVIVCIRDRLLFLEICDLLCKFKINAVIFHYFNNISFLSGHSFWATEKSYRKTEDRRPLSVNLVCADHEWIFKKFADRMYENLRKMGLDVSISHDTKQDVDINHHIPYIAYKPYKNDTLMITHVDNSKKLAILKRQLETAGMGICMSRDTMNKLISYGIARSKLSYINPAQDNVISPHKYVMGITNKCYDLGDVRKRATAILDVLKGVDPQYFRFIIMGSGWDRIVDEMQEMGYEVEYFPEFIYETYNNIMQKIDYYLFMGFDEGAMGYLDALAAGAGTIVTPQGYHLDTACPIDYPCSTVKQFQEALIDLQRKREMRVNAVRDWTWEHYSEKHLEIWNYLLGRKSLDELYQKQLCYEDGIYSALIEDNRI